MAVHVRSVTSLRTFLCRPLHINNVKLLSSAYFGERVKRILFSHLLAVHVAQLVQELFLKSVIDRTWIVESTSSIFLFLFLFFKIFFSSFLMCGKFFFGNCPAPPPPPSPPPPPPPSSLPPPPPPPPAYSEGASTPMLTLDNNLTILLITRCCATDFSIPRYNILKI